MAQAAYGQFDGEMRLVKLTSDSGFSSFLGTDLNPNHGNRAMINHQYHSQTDPYQFVSQTYGIREGEALYDPIEYMQHTNQQLPHDAAFDLGEFQEILN